MNLTPVELAAVLRCPDSYVYEQARTGKWPHLRVGRRIVFTPKHVETIQGQLERTPAAVQPTTLKSLRLTSRSAARQPRPVTR